MSKGKGDGVDAATAQCASLLRETTARGSGAKLAKLRLLEAVLGVMGQRKYSQRVTKGDLKVLCVSAAGDLAGYRRLGATTTTSNHTTKELLNQFNHWHKHSDVFRQAVTYAKQAAAETEALKTVKRGRAKARAKAELRSRARPLSRPNVLYFLVLRVRASRNDKGWQYRGYVGRAGPSVNQRWATHISHANTSAAGGHHINGQHVMLADALLAFTGTSNAFLFVVKFCSSEAALHKAERRMIAAVGAESTSKVGYANIGPGRSPAGLKRSARCRRERAEHAKTVAAPGTRCTILGVCPSTNAACKRCTEKCRACPFAGNSPRRAGHCRCAKLKKK